ncbi:hypothetical protein DQ238_04180 [Geodermatophilus sp. TF02-6]|nr:hypothetical protein DQ238_04180 [Geodermatophilus sp. TF02-6]
MLDELIGGGGRQQEYGDFIDRYRQGAPYDGISDEEAGQRYSEVAGEVDPQTYQDSARDAFGNMAPEERDQFAGQLQEYAQAQGVDTGWDGRSTDPDALAGMTSSIHQQNPGLLGALLGGGGGAGGLGGLLGGAGGGGALGGLLGGGGGGGGLGDLLGGGGGSGAGGAGSNPVVKAALAGIAAMAARRLMGGQGGPGR